MATIKQHTQQEPATINPAKFLTWLIIVASVMLFASLTSAYIVRRGEGNWLQFDIPTMFAISVVIAILSSVTIQLAIWRNKKDELNQTKTALLLTFGFGVAFCISQWLGWKDLVANNIHFVGNPSESFFYVISGLHLVHILGGMLFLLVIIIRAFQYKVHKTSSLALNLCATYWHFLAATWIYLYFFLLLNR